MQVSGVWAAYANPQPAGRRLRVPLGNRFHHHFPQTSAARRSTISPSLRIRRRIGVLLRRVSPKSGIQSHSGSKRLEPFRSRV